LLLSLALSAGGIRGYFSLKKDKGYTRGIPENRASKSQTRCDPSITAMLSEAQEKKTFVSLSNVTQKSI
jgi:hypothetical protein